MVRVPWSGASFLAYLGGFTILFGALSLLAVQADEHGDGGLVLWAALVYGVLAVLAYIALSTAHRVIAGLLATVPQGSRVFATCCPVRSRTTVA